MGGQIEVISPLVKGTWIGKPGTKTVTSALMLPLEAVNVVVSLIVNSWVPLDGVGSWVILLQEG